MHTRLMTWLRAALTAGLLVLLVAFAVGTERELTTSVEGRSESCGAAIPVSWLVSGTPDHPRPACGPVVGRSRVLVLTAMGAGGLLALVGWTGASTRREVVRGSAASAPRTVSS